MLQANVYFAIAFVLLGFQIVVVFFLFTATSAMWMFRIRVVGAELSVGAQLLPTIQ